MRLGIAAGPLLLLLWQVAPIDTVRDSSGRARLSLGFGGGQFEQREYSCNGDLVSANRVNYTTAGAQLDVWPTSRFRVTGFGGGLSSADPLLRGPYAGIGFAYEGRPVGIGAGGAFVPIEGGLGVPSFYLRLGNNDRTHFRLDLFNAEPAFGTTGAARVGVGRNLGFMRGASWYGGFSIPLDADGHNAAGLFSELSIPASDRLDLTGQAAVRSSEQFFDWGASVGLRYNFGR